jgi:RimJ/RimL family protein N-acetyltransferase
MVGVIEGPTVRLEPIDHAYAERIQRWYEDPELVAPYDRYEAEGFAEFEESLREAEGDLRSIAPRLVVVRRSDGRPIGCVGHYLAHPVLEYVDIWYVLGDPSARGHGFGSEAVTLLVTHIFATSAVARVGATCDVENVASTRLLEKIGMRREGTMRSAIFHHARWHDVYLYGITRAEWGARTAPRPA